MKWAAFSKQELMDVFHGESMSSKHMLTLYSCIIGLSAKIIVDLGLGNSTRTCRAAAQVTGGKVYSCDMDESRYKILEEKGESDWQFLCCSSHEALERIPAPFDIVYHDASHEKDVVRKDIELILPRMKTYGLVLIHDTQQPRYKLLDGISEAISTAPDGLAVSSVTLPFGCGLTILRIEKGPNEPIVPAGKLRGDRIVTVPQAAITLNSAAHLS